MLSFAPISGVPISAHKAPRVLAIALTTSPRAQLIGREGAIAAYQPAQRYVILSHPVIHARLARSESSKAGGVAIGPVALRAATSEARLHGVGIRQVGAQATFVGGMTWGEIDSQQAIATLIGSQSVSTLAERIDALQTRGKQA